MDKNTGYIITAENSSLLATITGKSLDFLERNQGWAAVFDEDPYPRWQFMPKNVAERRRGFTWVDSPLNGLPSRTEKEIRKEWAEVNKAYGEKLAELRKELERAQMRDGEHNGSQTQA